MRKRSIFVSSLPMSMKWIFCSLMIICLSTKLWAQNWYHTHLSKSDGLPSNEIFNIFQDQKGFIWIASEEGLTRYDGIYFKNFYTPPYAQQIGLIYQTGWAGKNLVWEF